MLWVNVRQQHETPRTMCNNVLQEPKVFSLSPSSTLRLCSPHHRQYMHVAHRWHVGWPWFDRTSHSFILLNTKLPIPHRTSDIRHISTVVGRLYIIIYYYCAFIHNTIWIIADAPLCGKSGEFWIWQYHDGEQWIVSLSLLSSQSGSARHGDYLEMFQQSSIIESEREYEIMCKTVDLFIDLISGVEKWRRSVHILFAYKISRFHAASLLSTLIGFMHSMWCDVPVHRVASLRKFENGTSLSRC